MIKKIDVLMPVYSSNFGFLLASVKSIQAQSVPTRLICILNGMSASANKRYKDFLNDLNVDVIFLYLFEIMDLGLKVWGEFLHGIGLRVWFVKLIEKGA